MTRSVNRPVRLSPFMMANNRYCHRFLWLLRGRPDVEYHGYLPRDDEPAGPVSWTAPGYEDLLRNVPASPLRSFKSPLEKMNEVLAAGKEATIRYWPVRATYGPYALGGEIDCLRHTTAEARLILDYKTGASLKTNARELLQVQIYGLMLELNGKDTSNLVVGVASVLRTTPTEGAFSGAADVGAVEMDTYGKSVERAAVRLRDRMLRIGQAQAQTKGKGWTLLLVRYEPEAARRCLDALVPAMGKEPPGPLGATPRKCAACYFNAAKVCDVAQSPIKPGFLVSVQGKTTIVQRVRVEKPLPDEPWPRRGSRVNLLADNP